MIGRLFRAAPFPSTGMWPSDLAYPGVVTTVPVESIEVPYVTESQALDLPVVDAFLGTTCSLLTQMPLGAYTATGQVDAASTPAILRNPAPGPGRTMADWVCECFRDLALWGNYVAVLGDRSATGWPAFLYPVPWGQWSIQADGSYLIGGQAFAAGEVFHVRRNCCTGEMVGRGLMATHRRLLAAAVAAEEFASNYFSSGGTPTAAVTHPNSELTQGQADMLKSKFKAATRRREAVIVPAGTTVTLLNSDADSAQLNETRRWNAHQLALAVGMPPALLGLDSPGMTYRNISEVAQQYLATTLLSYLVPLEQQLTLQCLPRTLTARFDTSAILRPDLAERMSIATQGLDAGIYTSSEARALVDLPPQEGTASDATPEQVATMVQKLYLGVGKVITEDEARAILNEAGAGLTGPLAVVA